MATVAEFAIPADEFPLGRVFEGLPGVAVEIERVVPTNRVILPYLWVSNVPVEQVEAAIEPQGPIDSLTVVDSTETEVLIRVDWNPEAEGVLTALIDADLTLLAATGSQTEWQFQLRAEDSEQITAFQQYCTDHDIDTDLIRLHGIGGRNPTGLDGLTSHQREALLLAYNNGYYEIPRESSLETLAGELNITRQSLANRLRRGHKNLISETLVHT